VTRKLSVSLCVFVRRFTFRIALIYLKLISILICVILSEHLERKNFFDSDCKDDVVN
jgi:hypothetical protein